MGSTHGLPPVTDGAMRRRGGGGGAADAVRCGIVLAIGCRAHVVCAQTVHERQGRHRDDGHQRKYGGYQRQPGPVNPGGHD